MYIKNYILFLFFSFDLFLCESQTTENQELKQQPCTISTLKITPGMLFGNIADSVYVDDHFGTVLALYNNIEPSKLKVGMKIKIPNLACMLNKFEASGKSPIYHQMIQLEKVIQGYRITEPKLISFRRENNYPKEMIPPDSIRKELWDYSVAIDSAISGIKTAVKKNRYKLPHKMLGQLDQVSRNLKSLSEGHFDGDYFYDTNMVYQNAALAIKNGIMWVKSGYN